MAINLLELKPHKISRDLSGYITYIYGAPKIGKTSLAAQADDCLLIATERGYNAIPGIIAQDVTCWRDMREVYRELKKPEVKATFKTIIVDTIDLAAKYCSKFICSQQDVSELGDLPYGKGYNLMRSEFEDVFNSLAQMGYAIIFISHAQDSVFTRENGTEYNKIIPSLSPAKVNALIENMADIYGYAHLRYYEDGSSKPVLTLRSVDDSISCGCRFKYIQNEINFNYTSLVEAISKAIDAEEAHGGTDVITNEPSKPSKTEDYNFQELKYEFQDIVTKIQSATGADFKNDWAGRITAIIDRNLGKGKKVNDMTPNQAEILALIVSDLKDAVANGL